MDFSIVLPAYNNLSLFRHSLESVRRQREVAMEIIVVDDSDKNDDIEQYVLVLCDTRIRYHHNHPPLGAVSNWNSGLGLCHGDIVIVVHHDEELRDDDFLVSLQRQMQSNDVAICNVEVHPINETPYRLCDQRIKELAIRFPVVLFAANVFGPCAVIAVRKNVLELFDERMNWFVDVEWYYRLVKKNKAVYAADSVIVSHHGHKGQITEMIDIKKEGKTDAAWLKQKYQSDLPVRLAVWMNLYVFHNDIIRKVSRKRF